MVGHVEKENLRRAEQQRGLDARRLARAGRARAKRRSDGAACRAGAARSRPAPASARGRVRAARQGPLARRRRRASRRARGGGAARRRRCRRQAPSREARRGVGVGGPFCACARPSCAKFLLACRRTATPSQRRCQPIHPAAPPATKRLQIRRQHAATLIACGGARARRSRGPPRRARGESRRVSRRKCGRDGPDPTRYGDWEMNGLASDF